MTEVTAIPGNFAVYPSSRTVFDSPRYLSCNNRDGYSAATKRELDDAYQDAYVLLNADLPFKGSFGKSSFSVTGYPAQQTKLRNFNTNKILSVNGAEKISRISIAGKHHYKVCLHKGQPLDVFNTHRCEFVANEFVQRIPHNTEVVVAFAFKTPKQALSGDGLIYAHSTANVGNSGIYWHIPGQQLRLAQWFCDVPNGTRAAAKNPTNPVLNSLHHEWKSEMPIDTWVQVVMHLRAAYLDTDLPYLKAWVRYGDEPIVQVADNTYRNAWNTPGNQFSIASFGPYWWTALSSPGDYSGDLDPWNGAPINSEIAITLGALRVAPMHYMQGHQTDFDWLSSKL